MKHKHTVEVRNETDKDEIFNKYKDSVCEHILCELGDFFNFNLDLLVIFRHTDEEKKFINEETINGGTTIVENRYAIILNIASLEAIPHDNGFDLALSVYHELCHLYDLHFALHNKYHRINPLYKSYKSFKDFTISKGWLIWTEFHAYFLTYKKFSEGYDCPTRLHIVTGYEELSAQFEKIKQIQDFEVEESKTMLSDFVQNIEDFTYFTAKHLAGVSFCGSQYNVCDEKMQQSSSYKAVAEIFVGITKKLRPLVHNTYGIGMTKKLYKLGEYLLEAVYAKFNIFPTDCGKQIRFAYYD